LFAPTIGLSMADYVHPSRTYNTRIVRIVVGPFGAIIETRYDDVHLNPATRNAREHGTRINTERHRIRVTRIDATNISECTPSAVPAFQKQTVCGRIRDVVKSHSHATTVIAGSSFSSIGYGVCLGGIDIAIKWVTVICPAQRPIRIIYA